MQKFCCQNIESAIIKYKAIEYEEIVRGYFLNTFYDNVSLRLLFCPFCGSNLGKELNAEYFDILEREYGIDDPDFVNFTNVPNEFKTDEWWRKRGL